MLAISHLTWTDEGPVHVPAPLTCRLGFRHRWVRVWLPGGESCVMCQVCERTPSRTIFESPVP
ncbi:hypothetical protein NOCA2540037 [metagenome]|uniref:Uncharacterized protein n=1 Tax=metagenome TaxID=256318 RepID=A0A2P2C9V8_9ZZZZ